VSRHGRVLGFVALLAAGAPAALLAQESMDLEGAIRTALSRSPSIEAAEAGAAAAASARWADWGAFLPTARASASLSQMDFTNVTYLTPEGSPAVIDPPLQDVSKSSAVSLGFGSRFCSPNCSPPPRGRRRGATRPRCVSSRRAAG